MSSTRQKALFLVMLVAFFMSVSGISFGEHPGEEGTEKGHKGMDKGKHSMMMMKKMMTGREMVATKDGGVIVLTGNKLVKYDKNLNLIKEVELEAGMECTAEMMEKRRRMMKKDTMGNQEASE